MSLHDQVYFRPLESIPWLVHCIQKVNVRQLLQLLVIPHICFVHMTHLLVTMPTQTQVANPNTGGGLFWNAYRGKTH